MTTITDERRTLGFELRDVETTDTLTMLRGRAVPYGVETDVGWFLEEFAPGSLGKSARESAAALPLMLFHGEGGQPWPIGTVTRWDEQTSGLWGDWRIDSHPDAQRAAVQARDGLLGFMSVRFMPIRSEWTLVEDLNPDLGSKDRVVRKEARLLEVSLVPTPAYNEATVQWVRSGEGRRRGPTETPALDAWRRELDQIRR